MRYRGWMLVFAGLLAAPQVGVSGQAWPGRYSDTGDYVRSTLDLSAGQRYRPYAQTPVPAYPYTLADWQRPASPPRFRYRPWEAPAPRYPQPVATPPGRSTASYWGGVPAASTPPDRFRPMMVSPSWTAPAGDPRYAESTDNETRRMPALAGAGELQRYRFRPREEAPMPPGNGGYRYHSLPMQIPDHYVYRPLNPVARASHARTAPAPEVADRWSGRDSWNRFAAQPYGFVPPTPWPYPPVMNRLWTTPQPYPVSAYRPPLWMPSASGYYPPAYAANGYWPNPYSRPLANRQPVPLSAYNRRYAQYWAPPPSQPYGYPRRQWPMPPAPYWAHDGWQRTARLPSPPPVGVNRFGTDWYDGQGDGEGAWYRLTLDSAPALTQSASPQPSSTGEWEINPATIAE